ncbi:MAG: transporter substrate-binding domain-containing protein [Victivallaceae bacterium]|nr:transporter substrate-binding domain-containing protein [Victivallaceae bacterium]
MKHFSSISTLVVCLMSALALSFVAGCGDSSEEQMAELRVGFDDNFAPFVYKDQGTGEYTGFDIELAREVCHRNGWTLRPVPIKWDRKFDELEMSNVDCIWSCFSMTGRESRCCWTKPYFENCQKVVVKASSDIMGIDDLRDRILCVQLDTPILRGLRGELTGQRSLVALGKSIHQIVPGNSSEDVMEKLNNGSAEAVMVDEAFAMLRCNDAKSYRILPDRILPENCGIGFRLGAEEMRDKVQSTLLDMVKDGTAQRISEKFFGVPDKVIIR